jgi:hypothetical protein
LSSPLVHKAQQICKLIKDKASIGCLEEDNKEDQDDLAVEYAMKRTGMSTVGASFVDDEDGEKNKPVAVARNLKKAKIEENTKSLIEVFMASEMAASRREAMASRGEAET